MERVMAQQTLSGWKLLWVQSQVAGAKPETQESSL